MGRWHVFVVLVLALLVLNANALSTRFKRTFGKEQEQCGCECPCHCCEAKPQPKPVAIGVPENSLKGDVTSKKEPPKSEAPACSEQDTKCAASAPAPCFGLDCEHSAPAEKPAEPNTVTLPNGMKITTQKQLPPNALQPPPPQWKIHDTTEKKSSGTLSDREVRNAIEEAKQTVTNVQKTLGVSPSVTKELAPQPEHKPASETHSKEPSKPKEESDSAQKDVKKEEAKAQGEKKPEETGKAEHKDSAKTDSTPSPTQHVSKETGGSQEKSAESKPAQSNSEHTNAETKHNDEKKPTETKESSVKSANPTPAPTTAAPDTKHTDEKPTAEKSVAPTPAPTTAAPTPAPITYAQCFASKKLKESVQTGVKPYAALLSAIPQGKVILGLADSAPVCSANQQTCLEKDTHDALKTFEAQLPQEAKDLLKAAPICKA